MEKAPIALITVEGMRFRLCDQAEHSLFVRSDLTVEYIPMIGKTWGYSLKFQKLEVSH